MLLKFKGSLFVRLDCRLIFHDCWMVSVCLACCLQPPARTPSCSFLLELMLRWAWSAVTTQWEASVALVMLQMAYFKNYVFRCRSTCRIFFFMAGQDADRIWDRIICVKKKKSQGCLTMSLCCSLWSFSLTWMLDLSVLSDSQSLNLHQSNTERLLRQAKMAAYSLQLKLRTRHIRQKSWLSQ